MSQAGIEALRRLNEAAGPGRAAAPSGRKAVALTGNEAIAWAVQQIDYGTIAAFPITPSTELAHDIAKAVADGEIRSDFIAVESEHSAVSVLQAAAAAGNRVFTATSSAGLALMHEILHYMSGSRLPCVIASVNRSIGGPLNILCDHSTIMAQRDTGWLQLFAGDAQEAYLMHILAPRWAESVNLPCLVNTDGFELSHITDRLEILPDETVKQFVGKWSPPYPLATDSDRVVTYPGIAGSDYYPEIKESQMDAMRRAPETFEEIAGEFAPVAGRKLDPVEGYRLEDAEIALVALGSSAGTMRNVIASLRSRGVRAGLLAVKMFRPFPAAAVAGALGRARAVGVMERTPVLGSDVGPLTLEVRNALFDLPVRPKVVTFIFGLGGRMIETRSVGMACSVLNAYAGEPQDAPYKKVFHLDVRDASPHPLILEAARNTLFTAPAEKTHSEIRMFARGGEGIKTACKMLASAAIEAGGKYAQGFSVYGAERSGAPTQGYVRIGGDRIHLRSPIVHSDMDVFVNPGLLSREAIRGLRPDGILLVNTPRSPAEVRKELGAADYRICTVDGYRIAQEELGDRRRNSIAMTAALLAVAPGVLDIHTFLSHLETAEFKSKGMAERNMRAAARAFFEVQAEPAPGGSPALKREAAGKR